MPYKTCFGQFKTGCISCLMCRGSSFELGALLMLDWFIGQCEVVQQTNKLRMGKDWTKNEQARGSNHKSY